MKVVFSKYAKQELDDATYFYEIESQGLGKRFRGQGVKSAVGLSWPLSMPGSGEVFFIEWYSAKKRPEDRRKVRRSRFQMIFVGVHGCAG